MNCPDIADVAGFSGKARWNTKMQSHELSGPCPFGCGVRTAFHVYPDMNEIPGIGALGYFLCMDGNRGGRAGCGRSGDVIGLVMQRDRVDFDQACTTLGIDPQAIRIYRKDQKVRQLIETDPHLTLLAACTKVGLSLQDLRAYREKAVLPAPRNIGFRLCNNARLAETSEQWRLNAYALARVCSARLGLDERAKEYLHSRGIVDEIIRANHYGLYDQYKWVSASLWGYRQGSKRMVIPRGIVIPWMDADYNVRCVRIRRLPWDESDEASRCYGVDPNGEIGRYTTLYGVYTDRLYNDHHITPGCSVALFEGEFTSVVAQQACKDIVCIATGSTAWGFNERNIRLLASCEKVLICFDADRAGDKASERWLDRLSNALRWRPLWDDANDMAIDGVDVGEWLALGFEESDQDASHQAALLCRGWALTHR
jgi:Toprim-like